MKSQLGAQALVLLICAFVALAAEINLDGVPFHSAKMHRPHLVKFYAPWCGACKSFASEWTALAKIAEDKYPDLVVGNVDCDQELNHKVCKHFRITAYPTVKLLRENAQDGAIEYDGAQNSDALDRWLGQLQLNKPSHKSCTQANRLRKTLRSIMTRDKTCELLFNGQEASLVISCAIDTGAAIRAALEGRKIDSVLVNEMPTLSVLVDAQIALDLEHVNTGLLFLRLHTVTINTLLCIY